jgi:phospholipid-translocating ATPase
MFLAVILFNDSFVTITSITYTTLILIEFLNVIQEVTHIRREVVISIFLSSLVYVTSIYFFNTLFQVKLFMDRWFFPRVAAIAAASWLPLWILKKIVDWYDPSAVQKVRTAAR